MRSFRYLAREVLPSSIHHSRFFAGSRPVYAMKYPAIQQLLQGNLPHLQEYLDDMSAIYEFLHDRESVFHFLDKLEKSVITFAHENASEKALQGLKDTPYKNFKIFSDFLYPWSNAAGFSGSAKILRLIEDPKVFHQLLKDGLIIKDNIHDRFHGIWSHAIQQYLVIEKYRESNGAFLKHDPIEIYKAFGDIKAAKFSPWVLMYDHPDDPSGLSSISLTQLLNEDIATVRWPFLSRLIRRAQSKMDDNINPMEDRMRRKHPDEFNGDGVVRRKS